MDKLEKCIGSLKNMRDYSDPYEVDADELDYAIDILESLDDVVYKVCKTKAGSPYGSMTEGDKHDEYILDPYSFHNIVIKSTGKQTE